MNLTMVGSALVVPRRIAEIGYRRHIFPSRLIEFTIDAMPGLMMDLILLTGNLRIFSHLYRLFSPNGYVSFIKGNG